MASTNPPDPTGVRRLVAAAEAVTSMKGQRRAGYLHTPARVEVPEEDLHKLFYAIGAVRVSELERVVEWVRNWLPEKFHGEDVNRGGGVPIHTEFSELIEIRQALAALYAPKEKP